MQPGPPGSHKIPGPITHACPVQLGGQAVKWYFTITGVFALLPLVENARKQPAHRMVETAIIFNFFIKFGFNFYAYSLKDFRQFPFQLLPNIL